MRSWSPTSGCAPPMKVLVAEGVRPREASSMCAASVLLPGLVEPSRGSATITVLAAAEKRVPHRTSVRGYRAGWGDTFADADAHSARNEGKKTPAVAVSPPPANRQESRKTDNKREARI
jgi:hypothetical protein